MNFCSSMIELALRLFQLRHLPLKGINIYKTGACRQVGVQEMATILNDVHIWTLRQDSTIISDADLFCIKYEDKSQFKNLSMDKLSYFQYARDKVSYAENRNKHCFLSNARPSKLKSSLRELENILSEEIVVFSKWRSPSFYQICFSSGCIANIEVNRDGDVAQIHFDKSLIGKFFENISSIDFTSRVMVVAYSDPKVTVITFGTPITYSSITENVNSFNIKILHTDITDQPLRRVFRKVRISLNSKFVMMWWSNICDNVLPWSPTLEKSTSNLRVYSLGHQVEQIKSMITTGEPILIKVIENDDIFCLEQKKIICSTKQKKATVELQYFFISEEVVQKIPLCSRVTCADLWKNLVVLGCADGQLLILNALNNAIEYSIQCFIIPSSLKINSNGTLVVLSDDAGHLQCYDIALSPIKFQKDQESYDLILDLGQYLKRKSKLLEISWSHSRNLQKTDLNSTTQNMIMLRFEGGPLTLLRILSGCKNSGFYTPLDLTIEYLKHQQYSEILRFLSLLNWSFDGQSILTCLSVAFNSIMRSKKNLKFIEHLLALFYNSSLPIREETYREFSEPVRDLSRRFLHCLLRHGQLRKAFQLAVDINDYDLFIDITHAAARNKFTDLQDAAVIKAKLIYETSNQAPPSFFVKPNHRELSLPSICPNGPNVDDPSLQPQLNATYIKSTSANLITTSDYQVKTNDDGTEVKNYDEEKKDGIKVIHFGVV